MTDEKELVEKAKIFYWPCGSWCYQEHVDDYRAEVGLSDDYAKALVFYKDSDDVKPHEIIDALVTTRLQRKGEKIRKNG